MKLLLTFLYLQLYNLGSIVCCSSVASQRIETLRNILKLLELSRLKHSWNTLLFSLWCLAVVQCCLNTLCLHVHVVLWDPACCSSLPLLSRTSNCSSIFMGFSMKYLVFRSAPALCNRAPPQLGLEHVIMHNISKHKKIFGSASVHLRICGWKYLVFSHIVQINWQSNTSVYVPTPCLASASEWQWQRKCWHQAHKA